MKKVFTLLLFLIFMLGCETAENNLDNQVNNPVIVGENVSPVKDSASTKPIMEPLVEEEVVVFVQPVEVIVEEVVDETVVLGQNLTDDEINDFIDDHPKGDYTVYITGSDLEVLTFEEAANLYEIDVEVFINEMISRFNIKKSLVPSDKINSIGVYYKPREVKDLAEKIKLENEN